MFVVRYVLFSEIPYESFLSHVTAVSYCYHEDWRVVYVGLLDLVMSGGWVSGDFIYGLFIQDLGFRPPYVCGLVCDGLLISRIPSLFDVLVVELLKLVRRYLGLSILYGFFAGVRIVKSGFL